MESPHSTNHTGTAASTGQLLHRVMQRRDEGLVEEAQEDGKGGWGELWQRGAEAGLAVDWQVGHHAT